MGRPHVRVVRPQATRVIRPASQGATHLVPLEAPERDDLREHRRRLLSGPTVSATFDDGDETEVEEVDDEDWQSHKLQEPVYSPPPAPRRQASFSSLSAGAGHPAGVSLLPGAKTWVWAASIVILGSVLYTGWSLWRKVTS